MKNEIRLAVACLLSSIVIAGTVSYPRMSQQWQTTTGYVPSSTADVTTTDSYLDRLYLANKTSGSVTVTLTDKSTNCGGAGCQIWPVVSIAANTVYIADLGGVFAPGGVQWVASAGSSVVGWIRGTYPQN